MSEIKYNFNNTQTSGISNFGDVQANQQTGIINNNYVQEQKQSLAEAAKEIEELLNQLAQSNPTTTEYEKQVLVNKFNEEVKTNSQIRDTLLAGGIELIKMLCPPLGIPIEMGKKWLETAQKNNPHSDS